MQISLRFTAFIRCCLLGLSVAGTSRAQMGLALPTPPKSTAISGASCSKAFHYGDPAAEDYITNCLDEREKPYVVMLGHRKFSAVLLHVRTTTELRSRKVKVGDVVAAYTVEAVKFADGTVVPKRSTVTGKVEGLVQRGHGVKNAVMGLAFTAIQLPDGKQMPILSRLKAGFQPFVAASISVGMPGSPTTNATARLGADSFSEVGYYVMPNLGAGAVVAMDDDVDIPSGSQLTLMVLRVAPAAGAATSVP